MMEMESSSRDGDFWNTAMRPHVPPKVLTKGRTSLVLDQRLQHLFNRWIGATSWHAAFLPEVCPQTGWWTFPIDPSLFLWVNSYICVFPQLARQHWPMLTLSAADSSFCSPSIQLNHARCLREDCAKVCLCSRKVQKSQGLFPVFPSLSHHGSPAMAWYGCSHWYSGFFLVGKGIVGWLWQKQCQHPQVVVKNGFLTSKGWDKNPKSVGQLFFWMAFKSSFLLPLETDKGHHNEVYSFLNGELACLKGSALASLVL